MILSLLIVGVIFSTLIAVLGVSDVGETIIGWKGSAGYAMNTTMWSVASYTGGFSWLILAGVVIAALIILLYLLSTKKADS